MKKIFFLLFLFLLLSSCEVIEAPYFEESYLNTLPADERCLLEAAEMREALPNTTPKKRVLLEEMTGHRCGNCPTASKEAGRLLDKYGDDLVFVGIHTGPLATHNPNASKYFTDFTTEAGDEWYTSLNDRNAVPFGMVDRTLVGTNSSEWENQVQERLASPLKAELQVYTCYQQDSSDLGVVVDVNALENLGSDTRLSVILVEDQVLDWQKDYSVGSGSPDIENYEHKNVLRATLNGTWGAPLSSSDISASSLFVKSYSLELEEGWNPDNCKVIAYVHDFGTREVYQVAVKKLVE